MMPVQTRTEGLQPWEFESLDNMDTVTKTSCGDRAAVSFQRLRGWRYGCLSVLEENEVMALGKH